MAKSKNRFGKKLARLRKQRGWSLYEACNQTTSVKRESLTRLETGRTKPDNVRAETMLQLIHLYWPDIALSDFTDDENLSQYFLTRPVRG